MFKKNLTGSSQPSTAIETANPNDKETVSDTLMTKKTFQISKSVQPNDSVHQVSSETDIKPQQGEPEVQNESQQNSEERTVNRPESAIETTANINNNETGNVVELEDESAIWESLILVIKTKRKAKLLATMQKCIKRVLTDDTYLFSFQTGYEIDVVDRELRFVQESIAEITKKSISVKMELKKIEKEEVEPLSDDIILMQRVFKARIVKQEKVEVKENGNESNGSN